MTTGTFGRPFFTGKAFFMASLAFRVKNILGFAQILIWMFAVMAAYAFE